MQETPRHRRLPRALLYQLNRILPDDALLTEPEELRPYECDGLSAYRRLPAAVALPHDAEQVRRIVLACREHQVPIVARGAGTGLSGGALPREDALLLSLARLNRVLRIDPDNRVAVVQPGVRNLAVSQAARPYGLFYAPDPSSQIACTIGGNVADWSWGGMPWTAPAPASSPCSPAPRASSASSWRCACASCPCPPPPPSSSSPSRRWTPPRARWPTSSAPASSPPAWNSWTAWPPAPPKTSSTPATRATPAPSSCANWTAAKRTWTRRSSACAPSPRRRAAPISRSPALSQRYGLGVVNVFHAGDGNLHPLILYDANRPGELEKAERMGNDILAACVDAGGTITGEHGVGVEKLDAMCHQFATPELAQFHAVKAALDPLELLNPGKAVPTLHRCAELGGMHVHGGRLPHPELERF